MQIFSFPPNHVGPSEGLMHKNDIYIVDDMALDIFRRYPTSVVDCVYTCAIGYYCGPDVDHKEREK